MNYTIKTPGHQGNMDERDTIYVPLMVNWTRMYHSLLLGVEHPTHHNLRGATTPPGDLTFQLTSECRAVLRPDGKFHATTRTKNLRLYLTFIAHALKIEKRDGKGTI